MGGAVDLRLWVRKTREAKRIARIGVYNPIGLRGRNLEEDQTQCKHERKV